MKSVDAYAMELYHLPDVEDSLCIDILGETEPHVIQIGVGKSVRLHYLSKVIDSIIRPNGTKVNIHSITVPMSMDISLVDIGQYLINFGREEGIPIFYTGTNQTGYDVGAYKMAPGRISDQIDYHRKRHEQPTVVCPFFQNVEQPKPEPPKEPPVALFKGQAQPVSPFLLSGEKTIRTSLRDGFYEISSDPIPPTQDGFHEINSEKEQDPISDGFHEIPSGNTMDQPSSGIEKREMWTEDKARMERIGYIPIAAAIGADTFPEELGGGKIYQ